MNKKVIAEKKGIVFFETQCRWKFMCNRNNISDAVTMLKDTGNLQFGYLDRLTRTYGIGSDSVNMKHCVYNTFLSILIRLIRSN